MKKQFVLANVVILAIASVSANAQCFLDQFQQGWTGQLTFHCDQETNLTKNPIQFDISNGVKVNSAWGLLNAPTTASTQNNQVTINVGQQSWPKEDLTVAANQQITFSFSPSSAIYSITNFHVGSTHPATTGTIAFSQDSKSAPIPDKAQIILTPMDSTRSASYQFIWQDVKSGAAEIVKSGTYTVSVNYQGEHITAIPNEVTISPNTPVTVKLNYAFYQGHLTFALSEVQPQGATEVTANVTDQNTHDEQTITIPWGNQPVTLKNLQLDHKYTFSADSMVAANMRYTFDFSPENVTPSKTKTNYNVSVTAHGTPIPTYQSDFVISGLPSGKSSELTIIDQSGVVVAKETIHNGLTEKALPAGNYEIKASTVTQGDYRYSFNNGGQRAIIVTKNGSNRFEVSFAKRKNGSVVSGWPAYIAMGAVTDANITNPQQLEGRDVDAIFKYAGDGGNGDPGKIVMPIYTYNTINLANTLTQYNHHTVKPVMVVYTAQMSGGTSYQDFGDADLAMHFVNLMLVSQELQSEQAINGDVGSIVLNPDLIGMLQQNNLYDPQTGNLKALSHINVQSALAKAYWFVVNPHDWTLKLNNGKILQVRNATPIEVFEKAINGDFKPQGVYSPWDIKSAWESEAVSILQEAPTNPKVSIPTFTNTFNGWVQANNWSIKAVGANVTFGWQENVWNIGSANWIHNNYSTQQIQTKVSGPTAALWKQIGVYSGQYQPDFLVFDKYEMDPIPAAAGIGYVWNARDWDNYLTYVKQLSIALNNKPVMLWQIPGGHLQLVNGVDTRNSHAATAPDYFFGDTQLASGLTNIKSYIQSIILPSNIYACSGSDCDMDNYMTMNQYTWHNSNLEKAKDSHVFAILWGGGNTTSIGTFPQNDGGWLSSKVNAYEKHPMYL